jgi:hypothetical protein
MKMSWICEGKRNGGHHMAKRSDNLSQMQERILEFIIRSKDQSGYTPSLRDRRRGRPQGSLERQVPARAAQGRPLHFIRRKHSPSNPSAD